MSLQFYTGGGLGNVTAAANTRIRRALGGIAGTFTHLMNFRVVTGATAHLLTVLRGTSRTTVFSDLAAGGTALIVSAALVDGSGNAPANLDLLAIQLDDNSWHLTAISAWATGPFTATLSTAIPAGRTAKAGRKVVMYGVQGDTIHADYTFTLTASVTNQFPAVIDNGMSLVRATATGEPLVLDIDNPTNASTISYVQFGGTKT